MPNTIGIPVIANKIGGIPEAMGNSGILIDVDMTDPLSVNQLTDKYISAINRLLHDHNEYAVYSERALQRAKAYEIEQCRTTDSIYKEYILAVKS